METRENAAADEESFVGASEVASTGPTLRPKHKRLSMSVINLFIDITLLAILFAIGWLSAILRFVFPAPTTAGGWKLWGLTYDQWSDLQFVGLCALALGVLIHVMLHWNWVCSVVTVQLLKTRKRVDDGMQTLYGVGLLIVLMHLILAGIIAANYFVVQPRM